MSQASIRADSRFRRAPSAAFSQIGDEILVLDTKVRRSHRLLGAASAIWNLAVDGKSVEEIVTHLHQKFEVSEDVADADVRLTLRQLIEEGALQPAD